MLAHWNIFHRISKVVDEVGDVWRLTVVVWHKAAEVEACCNAEGGSRVRAELLCAEGTMGVVGVGNRVCFAFVHGDLVAEHLDEAAELDVVHAAAFKLEGLEASNLRNNKHDAVFATHELRESSGRVCDVLLTVSICEKRLASEHRSAEDVDPGSDSHVERWVRLRIVDKLLWHVEAVDELNCAVEMLVPWDIGKAVLGTSDRAL